MTTTRKRATMAARDAAGIAQADETTAREAAVPEAPEEKPAPTRRPRQQRAKKKVEPQGVSSWPLVAARAHPDLHAAWTTLVSSREYGSSGTETMKHILDEFFLGMDPFDDYTAELHRKEEERQAKRRRRR